MSDSKTKVSTLSHPLNADGGEQIKLLFRSNTDGKTSLEEISVAIVGTLRTFPNNTGKLGFVTGVIASEGNHLIALNMRRLEAYTNNLRGKFEFPIFCAADVFHSELLAQVRWTHTADFIPVWRKVISEGSITDLFQTPRWRISLGARDEHTYSSALGIRIHNLDEDPELKTILRLHTK